MTGPTGRVRHCTGSTLMLALRLLRLPTYKVEATAASEGSSEHGNTNGPTTIALFTCRAS